jgi:hypothetical protein
MRAPSQRYYVSALVSAGEFAPLVHGLLRQAGVRQADSLIGISDGAAWIAELLGDLGVKRHIPDVYHASTYFETLLQGLGFPEAQRAQRRRALLRVRSICSAGSMAISMTLRCWPPCQRKHARPCTSSKSRLCSTTPTTPSSDARGWR